MRRKDKNAAAILAFLGGFIGLHRFYVGQIGLGIVYSMLFFAFGFSIILGILDGIIFLTMDDEVFDAKYNRTRQYHRERYDRGRRRDTDFDRSPQNRRSYRRDRSRTRPSSAPFPAKQRRTRRSSKRLKNNPFKQAGIKKFKEFDIEAAIKDFEQALKVDPNDLTIHFNLGCAYSQTEQAEKAFYHIARAVEMGFNDFSRIDDHDALAYMRIQPQWEQFKENGYTLNKKIAAPKENLLDDDLLLQQLKKLNELKDKGLITEREFLEQKTKLSK
ncbi:MAG: NINE protein [Saprospiraceae bacterium]|nr:NINE protein [Saprospiraceae bacterium]